MPTTGGAVRRSISIPSPRPAGGASPVQRTPIRSVEAVLRGLPSHGWPAGWVGRRDRALLVLRHRAGIPFEGIAALTVDDLRIEQGLATVRTGEGNPVTLRTTEDCLICAPCALVRWLHALDLAAVHSDGRVVASVIARAAPLTAQSPHVCEGRTSGSPDTVGLRVFPERDRWTPGASAGLAAPAIGLERRSLALMAGMA